MSIPFDSYMAKGKRIVELEAELDRLREQLGNVIADKDEANREIARLREQVKALTQVVILHQKKLKEHPPEEKP
jgi:uncharacterized coiled-coil protein SlyX